MFGGSPGTSRHARAASPPKASRSSRCLRGPQCRQQLERIPQGGSAPLCSVRVSEAWLTGQRHPEVDLTGLAEATRTHVLLADPGARNRSHRCLRYYESGSINNFDLVAVLLVRVHQRQRLALPLQRLHSRCVRWRRLRAANSSSIADVRAIYPHRRRKLVENRPRRLRQRCRRVAAACRCRRRRFELLRPQQFVRRMAHICRWHQENLVGAVSMLSVFQEKSRRGREALLVHGSITLPTQQLFWTTDSSQTVPHNGQPRQRTTPVLHSQTPVASAARPPYGSSPRTPRRTPDTRSCKRPPTNQASHYMYMRRETGSTPGLAGLG